ncbi:MAG TPA: hypothetical protein VGU01_11465 [Sphingomicrobium sp.]|nr:hypothetical protein [Sphingomicrobium sp.]
MRKPLFLSMLAFSACSAPGGPYPSLQPRAAEMIDPRVPVTRPTNDRPVDAALAARLASLIRQAQIGDQAFDAAASTAERVATGAGAPESESWIAAQEALTAAIAARRPTPSALGDIDELGAAALQSQGGLAPSDLLAIRHAADEVSAVDKRQAQRIALIQRRLGL